MQRLCRLVLKYKTPLLSFTSLLVLEFLGLLSGWKYRVQDLLFESFSKNVTDEILLVEIDTASIRGLEQWPWSRALHASVLDLLRESEAKQVFFDIDFSRPSDDPAADERLASALRKSQSTRVVLPSFWQPLSAQNRSTFVLTEPLAIFSSEVGLVSIGVAEDGLVREVVHLDSSPQGVRPSAAAVLAQSQLLIPDQAYLVDFAIQPEQIPRVSYQSVLEGKIPAERFRNKTVFIGSTALELGDFLPVPVHGFVPGVVLQALAYQTLSSGQIYLAPVWTQWLPVFLLLFLWFWLRRISWSSYLLLLLALIGVSFSVAVLFYQSFYVLISIVPCIAMAILMGGIEQFFRFDKQTLELFRERLRRSRQAALTQVLFGANSDSIIVVDGEGKVRSVNDTANRLLQLDGKAEGQLLSDILALHGQDLPTVARRSAEGDRPELAIQTPRGERTLEVSVTRSTVDSDDFYTLIARDITRSKTLRDELEYRANHDPLTDLYNRAALNEALSRIQEKEQGALLLMDLDRFKQLNDSLGHSEGDRVLMTLAHRFKAFVDCKNMLMVRLGGDEFALYVTDFTDVSELKRIGMSLLESVSEPIQVTGMVIELSASMGIALYPEHASDGAGLLRLADVAMYSAKSARTQLEIYDESKKQNSLRSMYIVTALRRAIQENTLELYYQPKTSLSNGELCGVEALLRWRDASLGTLSPSEFVPLAENVGLINPLTLWTLKRALKDIGQWRKRGIHLNVAVNLSARHLSDNSFLKLLTEQIERAKLPPGTLELEITETELMADAKSGEAFSLRMQGLGVSLAIDDYGTGFSSMAYLKSLNLQTLKIDRFFIDGIDTDLENRHIVSATVTMAHNLGMKVVAEGIESQAELRVLQSLDCDIAQGYLISKPLPWDELLRFIDDMNKNKSSA